MVVRLTFPFSAYSRGVFEVLATGGHTALGGDDLDRLIVKWAKKQLNIKTLDDAEYAHFIVFLRAKLKKP